MKNLLLCSLSLLCFFCNGQNLKKDLDLLYSAELDLRGRIRHTKATALAGDEFVVIELKKGNLNKEFDLVKFDGNLKEVKRNHFSFRKSGDFQFLQLVYMEGQLVLFNTVRDKDSGSLMLYANPIDPVNLKWEGDPILLREIPRESNQRLNQINFDFIKSPDHSKLMILEKNELNRKNFLQFGIQVCSFKNGFELTWEQSYTMDQPDKLEDIETMALANDGTAYLLFIRFKEYRKSKRSGDPNYKYILKEFKAEKSEQRETSIDLKGEFITDIQIGINQNGDLICTGFYSSEGTFSTKGAYYLLYDRKTGQVIKESNQEFSLDFLTSNLNERKSKKTAKKKAKGKDVELENYDLDHIVLREDGGVIQVAERFYITTYTYTDINGFTNTSYTYNYEDLIILSISPDGRFDWTRKIRKNQSSQNGPSVYASYHLSVVEDQLLFFHNCNAQNLLLDQTESPKSWNLGKKASGMITEINSEGYTRKDVFCDVPGQKFIPYIQNGIQLESDAILFFGEYKNSTRYLRIRYLP